MKWIKLSDRVPNEEIDGKKVIIYRIMNDSQESLAISIHDTNMVKYCNPNETWWIALPEKPIF